VPAATPVIQFSLRSKLILSMALLLLGTTMAILFITRWHVRRAYGKLYTEQVQGQIEYFMSRQEERLQLLSDVCEDLVEKASLQKALAERNGAKAYQTVNAGLRAAYQGKPELGLVLDDPIDLFSSIRSQNLLRFLQMQPDILIVDAAGQPLLQPNPGNLPIRSSALRRLAQGQLEKITKGRKPRRLTRQQLGFAVLEAGKGPAAEELPVRLAEIVATPVVDAAGTQLGALLVAVPFVNVEEKLLEEIGTGSGEAILSGIWVEGVVHSRSLPEKVSAAVGQTLLKEIREDAGATGEFDVVVEGESFRVNFTELNPFSPFSRACQIGVYSLANLQAQQTTLSKAIVATGLFGTGAALFVVLFLSRNLTNPLRGLVAATEKIRQGDYAINLPVQTRDELGVLSHSFNGMVQNLALTRKYQSILSQVTDRDVADALLKGGVSLGGEEREVTVLFCDIRGFTSLTEGMPPQEIIALLNRHMTALTGVVHAHRGTVDKFVGDMIMAVFGAPKSYGNDAVRAARCAVGMLEARQTLNSGEQHPVEIGIGVATGRVVAGCMGSEDRLNFTVLGDRVNLAARFCSAASAGEIIIDETTQSRLPDEFASTSLGAMELKGFTEAFPAFALSKSV
jgi:class 3 adenylate cyclase